jgi:hypothetical protein
LVGDIPTGNGKIAKLFHSVLIKQQLLVELLQKTLELCAKDMFKEQQNKKIDHVSFASLSPLALAKY